MNFHWYISERHRSSTADRPSMSTINRATAKTKTRGPHTNRISVSDDDRFWFKEGRQIFNVLNQIFKRIYAYMHAGNFGFLVCMVVRYLTTQYLRPGPAPICYIVFVLCNILLKHTCTVGLYIFLKTRHLILVCTKRMY